MYVGGMIAIPIAPYVADTFGRRVGVVIGSTVMLIGVALVSIGYHVELFIIGRLVLGLGLGIAQVSEIEFPNVFVSHRSDDAETGMFSSPSFGVGSPATSSPVQYPV
jgi:MFS family permease